MPTDVPPPSPLLRLLGAVLVLGGVAVLVLTDLAVVAVALIVVGGGMQALAWMRFVDARRRAQQVGGDEPGEATVSGGEARPTGLPGAGASAERAVPRDD